MEFNSEIITRILGYPAIAGVVAYIVWVVWIRKPKNPLRTKK